MCRSSSKTSPFFAITRTFCRSENLLQRLQGCLTYVLKYLWTRPSTTVCGSSEFRDNRVLAVGYSDGQKWRRASSLLQPLALLFATFALDRQPNVAGLSNEKATQ